MLKASLRLTWKGLNHLTRMVLVGVLLLTLASAGLLLGLRYWVLPDIERYHGIITVSASRTIGQPVSIGRIEADWRGLHPHLRLTDVRILDKHGQTALVLHRVENIVSWMTLLAGEVRLESLELDQPDLLVKRDAQGMLYIAGMALSGKVLEQTEEGNLADWLLHQAQIVVRDARITWQDEKDAPLPLVFNHVNLRIENRGSHHRFAMRALPPAELSTQLDVRGDFIGSSFDELVAWHGQLYTQLDYTDLAAWRAWLPLPTGLKRGKGALRGWMSIANGKTRQLTADLVLEDVRAQLADDLPPLDLHALHGRIAWQEKPHGFEISTHKFSLQLNNGLVLHPADFFLGIVDASDKQPASGEVRISTLDLSTLVSLADSLPLERNLKKQIAELAPQGKVTALQAKWQGNGDKLLHYDVKAHFDQLSMQRTDKLPGFSGLSGEVNGSDSSGTLLLNSRKLTVDAPKIMPEPLAFDTLTAQSSWESNESGLEVKFSNISAANDDLAGTVFGSYRTLPGSPGLIDLNINLTRAAVSHADRYIPVDALDKETHAWIRSALLGGQANEFHLNLRGDLNDFPFPDSKKGAFLVRARAKGVTVDYAEDWPRLENANGELLIQGKRLEVTAPSATTVGGNLQKISVVMPDMTSQDLLLQVRGEAVGETSRCLDFIQKSPVRGYIDGFTDDMTAHGNGKLGLQVNIPLLGSKPVTVSGVYHFYDNEVHLGEGVPILYKASGDLLFTESSMHTRNASAVILGGSATLEAQSDADGTVQAKVQGKANIDSLRRIVAHPLLGYLHGGSDWEAAITVQKKLTEVTVTSDLYGLASDLPAPFAKSANETIPLRYKMKSSALHQDVLSLQYGKLLNARLLRHEEEGDWVIRRGTVSFGSPAKWPGKDGVWLTGTIPQLSLEGWGALAGATDSTAAFPVAGADVLVQSLNAYDYILSDLHINALNQNGKITAQLAAKAINGEVDWQTQGKGKLVARLKNLFLDKEKNGNKDSAPAHKPVAADSTGESAVSTEFPALDLIVEDLALKDKPLGKLELVAQQHGRDWLLEHMNITNPDGVLTVNGKWGSSTGKSQTQVNLKLEISNAGKILARSGYPNSVKNGSGKLEGEFVWHGGPDEFSYATLDGILKLDTGKGQFLKIDPGIGKLLGILSLQALPKHITLDFTDIFSEGFAFDSIAGTAYIKQGVLSTSDFRIDGSSAKVTMIGHIDLDRETQNLRVRILPTVGNSVSMIGAFAAGPAVGIGTFIVNKLLREPLDKLVSFEYNVTGTWDNPSVDKVGENKPAATERK